jgi:hypothetical protein
VWTEFDFLRIGFKLGSCENGNEPSGFIKGDQFLDLLENCLFLKMDTASCRALCGQERFCEMKFFLRQYG